MSGHLHAVLLFCEEGAGTCTGARTGIFVVNLGTVILTNMSQVQHLQVDREQCIKQKS